MGREHPFTFYPNGIMIVPGSAIKPVNIKEPLREHACAAQLAIILTAQHV